MPNALIHSSFAQQCAARFFIGVCMQTSCSQQLQATLARLLFPARSVNKQPKTKRHWTSRQNGRKPCSCLLVYSTLDTYLAIGVAAAPSHGHYSQTTCQFFLGLDNVLGTKANKNGILDYWKMVWLKNWSFLFVHQKHCSISSTVLHEYSYT
jgi:hypothetical protein